MMGYYDKKKITKYDLLKGIIKNNSFFLVTSLIFIGIVFFLNLLPEVDTTEANNKPANGFISIGDKLELEYVQHIDANIYKLGYKKSETLNWVEVGHEYSRDELNVVYTKEVEKPFIERGIDKTLEGGLFKPQRKGAYYILYIPKSFNLTEE